MQSRIYANANAKEKIANSPKRNRHRNRNIFGENQVRFFFDKWRLSADDFFAEFFGDIDSKRQNYEGIFGG